MNEFYRELAAYCGDKQVFEGLRINVKGRASMTLLPDYFLVSVYNMSDLDMALLEDRKVLKICSKDGAVLCSGEVEDIYRKFEGTNEIAEISLADGQTFWQTRLNKTVGGGASFSTTLRNILVGANLGSYLANDMRFFRSQTFCGRLADFVLNMATGVHARAFISNSTLHVVTAGKSEIIVKVLEDEIIEEPQLANGVCVLKVVVGSYPVGMLCDFRGKRYRIASETINADNFSGDWKVDLIMVDEGELDANGIEGG